MDSWLLALGRRGSFNARASGPKASHYCVRGLQVGDKSVREVWKGKGKFVEIPVNNGEIVWVSPMWITYKP